MSLFQGKEKKTIHLSFIPHDQLAREMKDLLKHYKTDVSKADLDKTRKILRKTSSLNAELSAMREENR